MSGFCHNKPKPINSDQIIRKQYLAPSKHDILMARTPDCTPRDISKLNEGDIKTNDDKSIVECTLEKFANKSGKDLIFGTMSGWIAGLTIVRVGKIAAFGLGARAPAPLTIPATSVEKPQATTTETILQPKPLEPFKPTEESFIEKPFIPPKPIPHSPKISPSSIPNPSPSVTTNKPVEPGYPNYGGYLYSIPGYSAFQPISYPGMMQPNQAPLSLTKEIPKPMTDFVPFPTKPKEITAEDKSKDVKTTKADMSKPQTDFENKFTSEIVSATPPVVTQSEAKDKNNLNESKMSITSLAQGSGATVTIPSQTANKDLSKKKLPERFSLKTSIPISKIDMKCVTTSTEPVFQNSLPIKGPSAFTPTFQMQKPENQSRVEIQSNIVIKTALKEPENKAEVTQPTTPPQNINTLINAAETINKSETTFRKPEPKQDVINEIKDPPPNFSPPATNQSPKPLFNPLNVESSKVNFQNKPTEGYNEQKNQILFIQNKNPSNPKMLLTIQQQNPQVLLQRTNFESKNLLAPSRLPKKTKEDLVENGASSKVVALKRLHQENCDENDFENLITENQIYGNKIVVKEKSQATLQEPDIKKNKFLEKNAQGETKNVVLQPNFLYLSNVPFPGNLMMIKNSNKITQITENSKNITTENKPTNEVSTMTNSNDIKRNANNMKTQNNTKENPVLKPINNTINTKNNKDLVFQTSQVLMNPQILYQVPMIVDTDNKLNQQFPKFISQNKKEYTKQFDKQNDKLFIACPYQMDSKLQPKIVITNIRPKIAKIDEISSLDMYERRRRLKRLKYLTHREIKDQKPDIKKSHEKVDNGKNVITPSKMKAEICKEFAKSKMTIEDGASESESDYSEDELNEYNNIINSYGPKEDDQLEKAEFLANFRLATREVYKEKELDRQERTLRRDSVASAYIAAGRLDRLTNDNSTDATKPIESLEEEEFKQIKEPERTSKMDINDEENSITKQKKQYFLSQLRLLQVSQQYKNGYEKAWHEILKERKRRNGFTDPERSPKPKLEQNLDPNGQLQLLTEIKKCVSDNNNLIKKRLDSNDENVNEGDSIPALAEKNFSELNRLSKLADQSVKLITGQDTRTRDLNPGFDSENIQKIFSKATQPIQNVPLINIPNISTIISLKTSQDSPTVTMTSQATSMDEPTNSAAGVKEMFEKTAAKDFSCQVKDSFQWPGVETIIKSFKEYDTARKREINELYRRNTLLRVEGVHMTRAASQHSERARALLAERQNLANEENNVTLSLQRLCKAIEVVRNAV